MKAMITRIYDYNNKSEEEEERKDPFPLFLFVESLNNRCGSQRNLKLNILIIKTNHIPPKSRFNLWPAGNGCLLFSLIVLRKRNQFMNI